jgi:hypothetical protein
VNTIIDIAVLLAVFFTALMFLAGLIAWLSERR